MSNISSSETRIRQGRCVSRIRYVSAACPRIPAYLGWKLRKGNVSTQSIRPSPTYHHPILCLCPTPDPSHAQSASRSRLRLPTGQLPPCSARVRHLPATSLRPRRRQGAPATATKSCTPPPATSPCDGNEELRPAGCNANEPLRRRVGDCTLPRAPCLGQFLSLPNPI